MNNSEEKIAIGKFTKPFGVHGLIKFVSYSGESAHLKKIKTVYVDKIHQSFEVEAWHTAGLPWRCKLKGFDTPESCTALLGNDVLVSKKFGATLQEGEYYLSDLIGIEIRCENRLVGSISGVITDSYAPLLEISKVHGNTAYIPFIKEFFDEPDVENQSIELLNEMLLDDEKENK